MTRETAMQAAILILAAVAALLASYWFAKWALT